MTRGDVLTRQTSGVQMDREVTVVEVDVDGSSGRPLGVARLVAPDVAVLRLGNREPMPSLPLRVLVPAAAGGGRDEHLEVDVVDLQEAVDGSAQVAVVLARPVEVPTGVAPGPSARTVTAGTVERASGDPWWCRLFPRACR